MSVRDERLGNVRQRVRVQHKRELFLIALGVFSGLFLIELCVRIYTHSLFTWESMDSQSYVISDPLLGRFPKPGLSVRHPQGFRITIGDYGTRCNGKTPLRAQQPLMLAVGDSFAFGDGVNDEDSWPAVLERLSGERVINAGVPGFGLDQAVLRAEQLAEIYAPETIIVSFIPHDVLRCEMSYWSGHPKPYFDIEGAGLHLSPAPHAPRRSLLKRLLSVSVAMDYLFPTFMNWEGPKEVLAHHHGREVACRLMVRLAALGRTQNIRIAVLAQPQQPTATMEQLDIKSGVLACATANHLAVLDLFPIIESLRLEKRAQLFPRHMSVEGNRIVATELARFLNRGSPHPAVVPEAQAAP